MNINRNNYEKYFIDYLEGTLSKDIFMIYGYFFCLIKIWRNYWMT